ncbi:MAG: hypothetical protein WAV86_14530 [Lutibacter sp.]
MKTKILLILIIVGFAVQSYAQIKTKVFTLNLGEPTLNSIGDSVNSNSRLIIKAREPLAFKLINGNPYKYKYVINHKLVNFFEGQSYNPLDSIKTKSFAGINSETTNGYIGTEGSNGDKEKLVDKINTLQKQKKIFNESKKRGLKSNTNWDDRIKEVDNEINKLNERLKEISSQSVAQYISKSSYSSNFIDNTKLNNLLQLLKSKRVQNQEDDMINIKNASIVLMQAFEDLKIDIEKYEIEISAEDFFDQSKFKNKREDFNSRFLKLLQDIQGISNEANNFTDLTEDFNKKVDVINAISGKIKETILKMYQLKLHNYLLPVDINGKNIDVVEVTVERYDKTATNPTPDKYSYNIWVKGGVKIDISGGLFLTSLMDKEYETKDYGTNKFIYEENKGDYEFGFGSTINVSLRGGSWVRPGLSIGALFTTNQKFQLLTGLGIILGKEERIVLHTGLSMGRISRVSDNYKTDGSISYDLGSEGTIPLTEKFSIGQFFGLTYNFGKVKKQDEK